MSNGDPPRPFGVLPQSSLNIPMPEGAAVPKDVIVFTVDEVACLSKYQFGPWTSTFSPAPEMPPRMHPFTCGNRDDGKHFQNGSDVGILVPTVRGWICPCCNYTQNWAHEFMKTWGKVE